MYVQSKLRTCARCHTKYDATKSPASLRLTYCNSLCEQADLGFSIEALLRYEHSADMEALSAAR